MSCSHTSKAPNPSQNAQTRGSEDSRPKRVLASDFKLIPFSKPARSQLNIHVPQSCLPKLLYGFNPQDMDDRWIIISDGPNSNHELIVRMYRSWSGFKAFAVKIENVHVELCTCGEIEWPRKKDMEEEAVITKIIRESDTSRFGEIDDKFAKEMVLGVFKNVLEVDLIGLPDEETNG